ncbi:hypothetical protein RhiJN_19194 [Ceratobasidium sp. AG-Ba]|nr:hypothetical protein RhiJN_19194 [Ceratobasidium sp. AG-Ba]
MSTYSYHTHSSRRSHSSSRPAQYVTAAPSSHYSPRTAAAPVQVGIPLLALYYARASPPTT